MCPLHRRPILAHVRCRDLSITEDLWRGVFLVPVRPSLRLADRNRTAEAAQALAAWMRALTLISCAERRTAAPSHS